MAKNLTAQQRKFKKANVVCFREASTPKEFGKCMSRELGGKKKKKKKKKR